ncbi:TetR/AcrR family transcriptional regulator [Mycolicibacterium monacense]|uniref:TetR family transcriptional regulator n=2 Tax=Mycobacteriaceae TaxID=1762 RepID=A0AAD1IXX4_MYCMB|nr:TetR/AcrR family transcriptional regulator [Mycolicibacterium monacense]MDA4100389.1 TetR family transcriptional regulator [Mycolicibacterium monacense DSM 44395]ORB21342.1 TetR family transcriptional regulator [Mycolicibacterium monacense DSM 44395]QHP84661.1 TetR/AcrR family transcriptional regulator [Mycolicibacterium monacense DSM 44395]BBZ62553.1 TetR family transcriptional regulator [Mycolicibacterium monacense]
MSETAAEDARVSRTRAAVADAVASLFEEEGASGLTHQRVATRAGVGRATVYRHWPKTVDLVTEALTRADQPLLHSGDGPLRQWLHSELIRAAEQVTQPVMSQFIAMMVANADQSPAARVLRENLNRRTRVVLDHMLDRAIASGELSSRPDTDELLATVLGAVMFRITIQQKYADSGYLGRLVDGALAEHWSRPPP